MINRKNCLKSLFFLLMLGVPMLFLAVHPSLAAFLVTPSTYWQLNDNPASSATDDTTTVKNSIGTPSISKKNKDFKQFFRLIM